MEFPQVFSVGMGGHIALGWQKIEEDVRFVFDNSLEKVFCQVRVDFQLVTECYMHHGCFLVVIVLPYCILSAKILVCMEEFSASLLSGGRTRRIFCLQLATKVG